MNVGLILGGGGIVGIAWELGVMAGLKQAAGFDPLEMSVIVGTSAGSAAGAQVALGKDLDQLVESQRRTGLRPPQPAPQAQQPAFALREDMMRLLASTEGAVESRAAALGKLAVAAETPLSEESFVESFRRILDGDTWPAIDYRATSVDCESGATVLWTKDHGIGLLRAVASSCAIPGFFPAIGYNGRRYMDGPRAAYLGALVKEKSLDGILFIGPIAALPDGVRANPELDALEAGGLPVVRITGGEGLAAAASNLMDPSARAAAVDAGVADGIAAGPAVSALLG